LFPGYVRSTVSQPLEIIIRDINVIDRCFFMIFEQCSFCSILKLNIKYIYLFYYYAINTHLRYLCTIVRKDETIKANLCVQV